MPAIRGDADVLALLDEMAAGGGGTSVAPGADSSVTRPSGGGAAAATASMAASAAAEGSDQRANPHLATLRSAYRLGPPTNPHVEVARHRRHEKVKAGFYDLFGACAPPPDAANVRQQSNGPDDQSSHGNMVWERTKRIKSMLRMAWTAVPPHSVWERYQFSLKALEAECVREAQGGLGDYVPPWCRNANNDAESLWHRLADPSVRDIYNWTVDGRSHGTVWEPLLPVPSIFASSDEGQSSEARALHKKYRRGSMDLLREEIEFQLRRTVKGGGGAGRGNTKGSARGVALSIDDMYATLIELDEASVRGDTLASEEHAKKKNAKKKKKRSKSDDREGATVNDAVDKEAYVLHAIFASDPFQKLLNKLHRKFHRLAEESYAAFLSDVQKCANRLLVEEQRGQSGGGRKRKRKGGGGGMPKIAYVDHDLRNNDDDGNANGEHQLTVTFAGVSLRINASHKDKLHSLYRRTLRDLLGREDEGCLRLFPRHLFAILLRYDALEGAGLQSAVPPGMFRFLHTRFGCGWECFASPFNCWFEGSNGRGGRYGSAFGDTDAPFGSAGGFFGMDFLKMAEGTGGCFQANPPFASAFIEKMCNRMNDCLAMANDDDMTRKEKPPLMFVIYVPAWTESTGWKAISLSPHLSRHLLLSQKEDVHYYAEGTQHRRANGEKGTHRIASFDTSVFFLQNNAAREKWPLVEEDDRMLKAAFALSPENSERMESSKGQKQRNDTVAAAKKMKKKKKKAPSKNGNEEGARKKRKLVTGGQEEMNILASMRILEDSTPKEESSKTIGGSKKKKGRRK